MNNNPSGKSRFFRIDLLRFTASPLPSMGDHVEESKSGTKPSEDGQKYLIFISARSTDYPIAEQVYEFLRSHNYRVFFAPREIPVVGISDYMRVIHERLDEIQHFILVTSCAENVEFSTAPWVFHEWTVFLNLKLGTHHERKGNLINVITTTVKELTLPVPLPIFQTVIIDNLSSLLNFVSPVTTLPPQDSGPNQAAISTAVAATPDFPQASQDGSLAKDPVRMIKMIPRTGPVEMGDLLPRLVDTFAEIVPNPVAARMILTNANAWRASADPDRPQRAITVPLGEVPSPEQVAARLFWQSVWTLARLRGARTVVSILLAADADGLVYVDSFGREIGQFIDSLCRK